jgi:hypothetical protein
MARRQFAWLATLAVVAVVPVVPDGSAEFASARSLISVNKGLAVAAAPSRLREGAQCSKRLARKYRAERFECRFGLLVSTWRFLERPLHLPRLAPGSSCPITPRSRTVTFGSAIGPGPVYPAHYAADGPPVNDVAAAFPPERGSAFAGSAWSGWKHVFLVADAYFGRVLIRGSQLDGAADLRFGSGLGPAKQLRIQAGAHETRTYTRVPNPGCYGYQIDGRRFSKIIIIRVTSTVG